MRVSPVREFSHEGRIYRAGEVLELPEEMACDGIKYGLLVGLPDDVGAVEDVSERDLFTDTRTVKKQAKKKKS